MQRSFCFMDLVDGLKDFPALGKGEKIRFKLSVLSGVKAQSANDQVVIRTLQLLKTVRPQISWYR